MAVNAKDVSEANAGVYGEPATRETLRREATRGALDFAGGTVVHLTAGVSALAAAFAVGNPAFKDHAIIAEASGLRQGLVVPVVNCALIIVLMAFIARSPKKTRPRAS